MAVRGNPKEPAHSPSGAPALGLQFRDWSGPDKVTDSDTGLALGLSVGLERRINDVYVFIPELVWQISQVELEGSVGSAMLGIQVSIVRMSR